MRFTARPIEFEYRPQNVMPCSKNAPHGAADFGFTDSLPGTDWYFDCIIDCCIAATCISTVQPKRLSDMCNFCSASLLIALKGPRSVVRTFQNRRIKAVARRFPNACGIESAPFSVLPSVREPITRSAVSNNGSIS